MRVCTVCGTRYEDTVQMCPLDGAPAQPEGLVARQGPDPLLGRVVGSYRIEKLLGVGGMSTVYQAVHPAIGSRVAVKFLREQYAADRTIVNRFFNEAKAVNLINHDNIVKILDYSYLDDKTPYFVMELLGAGSELTRLSKRPVGLDVVGPILLQVCDALGAAHAQGIIHRDLKPENIFLSERSGRKHIVKLMDFGIAKLIGGDQRQTRTGMVMGTPHYMSPEQASGKTVAVDGRSDIYSLGVILFQLACGNVPFDGESYAETLVKHIAVLPPRPRDLNPNIDEAYEKIILRCLAKDPADRYQTTRELAHEVGALMTAQRLSLDPPRIDDLTLAPAPSQPAMPAVLPPKAPPAQGIVARTHTPAVGVPQRPPPAPPTDAGVRRRPTLPPPDPHEEVGVREERPQADRPPAPAVPAGDRDDDDDEATTPGPVEPPRGAPRPPAEPRFERRRSSPPPDLAATEPGWMPTKADRDQAASARGAAVARQDADEPRRGEPPAVRKPASQEPEWALSSKAPRRTGPAVRTMMLEESPWAGHAPPDAAEAPPKKGRALLGAALVVVLAGLAGLAFFLLRPRSHPPSPEATAAYEKGRRLSLADVRAGFPEAQRAFEEARELAGTATFQVVAGLSELHAAWAEGLGEESDALDATREPPAGAAWRSERAGKLRFEARAHVNEACRLAKEAQALAPMAEASQRALLACARVAADPKAATSAAAALRRAPRSPENEAHLAAWSAFTHEPPDPEGAETTLTGAAAAMPTFVRAQVWLARVHLAEGHLDAARVQLAAILEGSPAHDSAKALLASLEKPAAVAVARPPEVAPDGAVDAGRAPADKPADPPPAAAVVDAGTAPPPEKPAQKPAEKPADKPADKPAERPAEASPPKPVNVDQLIAQAGKLLGRSKSKALALYEEALVARPTNPEALYGRGVALFDLGRVDEAIGSFEKSLEASPRFSDSMIVLADAYKLKGDRPNAARWYAKYLDASPDGEAAPAARRSLEELK